MKTTWIMVLALLGIFPVAACVYARQAPAYPGNDSGLDDGIPANDPDETGVTDFQDELPDVGQWNDTDQYGPVWVPQVDSNWRPYTDGHWANSDQGWAWMSNESWGWATYHYGRWYFDASLGWAWVPGSVWAPAWVAWQEGDGYLGWAPLPPTAGFTLQAGLGLGGVSLAPSFYTFVLERDILAQRISRVIVTTRRNRTIMRSTRDVTRYAVVNNHVFNRSIDAQRITRITGRPVPTLHVASLAAKSQGRKGPFYQPAALRRASHSMRAEFGRALPAQAAAQRRAIQQTSPHGQTAGYSGSSTPWNGTGSGGGRSPQTRSSSGSPYVRAPSQQRSQPQSARSSAPPQRQASPPPRPSTPPPQRQASPPAKPSPPPAQSGGHKPPV